MPIIIVWNHSFSTYFQTSHLILTDGPNEWMLSENINKWSKSTKITISKPVTLSIAYLMNINWSIVCLEV